MEKTMMTINEYYKVSGLGQNTVRRLCHIEGFPALRVGIRWLIHREAADEWLKKQSGKGIVLETRH